jgi:anti-sigma B factor antagonist
LRGIQGAIYTGEIHMSMNANVLRDALGNITIQMSGDLDYENSMPLRRELNELSTENPHSKITVDLGGVDFVGSSGICHFVETIQIINKDKHESSKVSLSNVSTDFRKVFKLYTAEEAELIWDQMDMDSDDTSNMNSAFGNRKRTFQN